MTFRRLVLWSLLVALLGMAGATLAAASVGGPKGPQLQEPGPWWWTGARGDVYYAVIAPRPHLQGRSLNPPPGVRPIDPADPSESRPRATGSGASSPPKATSVSASLSAPGAGSLVNGSGTLAPSGHGGGAPARPDPREVRRHLESVQRALGL